MRTALRSGFLAFWFALFSGCSNVAVVYAQASKPAVPAEPALTATETVAVMSLSEKFKEVNQALANVRKTADLVEAEVAKQHPGYHLDESTGNLAKDVPPPVKNKLLPVVPAKDAPAK